MASVYATRGRMDYLTDDESVRVFGVVQEAPWRRFVNQRGGKYVVWFAHDLVNNKRIVAEYPRLKDVKRALVERGYCNEPCTLHRRVRS